MGKIKYGTDDEIKRKIAELLEKSKEMREQRKIRYVTEHNLALRDTSPEEKQNAKERKKLQCVLAYRTKRRKLYGKLIGE